MTLTKSSVLWQVSSQNLNVLKVNILKHLALLRDHQRRTRCNFLKLLGLLLCSVQARAHTQIH